MNNKLNKFYSLFQISEGLLLFTKHVHENSMVQKVYFSIENVFFAEHELRSAIHDSTLKRNVFLLKNVKLNSDCFRHH